MLPKKILNYSLVLILTLSALLPGEAQLPTHKEITIRDFLSFMPRSLQGLRSMEDGAHYTIQEGTRIEKYAYKSGEKVATLFDAADSPALESFSGYAFSADERQLLLSADHERIYRHSFKADYYLVDLESGKLEALSKGGKQQLATFSPKGDHVAFVRGNNLHLKDLQSGEEKQLTSDGTWNHIINGGLDWVYEEEFGFSQGFHWSPDGRKIAYYRFDESRVKQFNMTMYGALYPQNYAFKYPKAGEENSLVSIHVYDLESETTRLMDVGSETDQYIPRIQWTSDPEVLSIMRLNRLQNQLDILHAEAGSGDSRVVYQEVNERYISEASDNTITYLADGKHFILNSEREGYFRFYLYNFHTGEIQPINQGDYDVDEFLGYDPDKETLYYTSHQESVIEKHVYSIGLDGSKQKRLSPMAGNNNASFSKGFKYFILTHSSANSPHHMTLHNARGKEIRVLEDNARLNMRMEVYGFAPTEFLTIPTASGQELNAWMIKPADFDPSREYPLLVYVYGGPESQNVIDSWNYRSGWFQMLAQKGYIIACVDNRGTNGRGEAFRKATYMRLGELETIDQLEAAQWLGAQEYIDENRMGMYGWSYGGYMTSLCMVKGKGTFKMGIAGAPVTTWRYYDTVYTERFMRTPQENPEGYDLNSPIHFASGLQGKFLLIHGTGDDNVHFQNSVDFSEALVMSGKQFDMQFYPNEPHGFRHPMSRMHLYTRMTNFILENL